LCSNCNTEHDRDDNASQNIKIQGLNKLRCVSGKDSQDKQKQAEASSLDESVKLEASMPLG
jgi:transposase